MIVIYLINILIIPILQHSKVAVKSVSCLLPFVADTRSANCDIVIIVIIIADNSLLFILFQEGFTGVRTCAKDEPSVYTELVYRCNTSRNAHQWLRSLDQPLPGLSTLQSWLSNFRGVYSLSNRRNCWEDASDSLWGAATLHLNVRRNGHLPSGGVWPPSWPVVRAVPASAGDHADQAERNNSVLFIPNICIKSLNCDCI